MSKIIGPIHSDNARGLYGGELAGIIYEQRGSKAYALTLNLTIKHPLTIPVVAVHANFKCISELWKGFTDPDKAYWAAIAAARGLKTYPTFNQYTRLQMSEGWAPQLQENAQHLGTPAAPTALAANVVNHSIHITWTDGTLAYTSLICAGTTAGFTASMLNAIVQTLATDGEDRQATVKLQPGTYYLKAFSGDEDGGVGAESASVGPLVIG